LKIWQLLLISSICLLLTDCGWLKTRKIEKEAARIPVYKFVTYDCGIEPDVDKVKFLPVVWVITDDRYTLTSDLYANLGDNMKLIKRSSLQIWEIVSFYRDCILAAQERVNAAQIETP